MSGFDDISDLRVTKRDGTREIVAFDKILNRLKKIGKERIAGVENLKINYTTLAMKVIDQLYDGIHTTQIDELSAEQCASMASTHPDYNVLAGRIVVSNHHKNTSNSFSQTMDALYTHRDNNGNASPMISADAYLLSQKYADELDAMCVYERDYLIDYFGFKTLERSYLLRVRKRPIERPQHMWLRVALGIHGENLACVRETYEYMSQKYFTHATPTLFNSGTPHQQLSSCYLIAMENDSIEGIYNTLKDCALISKWAGGIGMHIHNVRASGSYIRGTGGSSNGIAPMLRVFNNTAKYVDQCLTPETILYTTRGPIPISHAVAGISRVFNREGTSETVANVLEHVYEGEIREIQLANSASLMRLTPEHLVMGLTMYRPDQDIETTKYELNAGLVQLGWMDAKDISSGDYIAHAIPGNSCVVDFAELTEDVCRIYGQMLLSIYLPDEGNPDDYHGSGAFSPHKNFYLRDTPENIQKVVAFMTRHCIQYATCKIGKMAFLYWMKSVHLPFKATDFWCPNTNRVQIGERWLLLPQSKIAAILEGLSAKPEDPIHALPQTVFLRLRAGIPGSGEFVFEDKLMVPVKSVSVSEYKGIVYDLQMTEEHNYLVQHGIVHNGGGKRNGSFAIYLEPWHADIELFLQMRKNHGDEELKARDLFYALWIPDLFMERIKTGGTWTLFCPDECPGLADVYGDEFVALYTKYEASGRGRKTMPARDLWFQVLDAQMETGTPYILYKDACNRKSNQKNLGTIKSSNLCVAPETLVLTDKGHVEIASICGQRVNVWNGEEWSPVDIVKTGENQELIEVHTNDGIAISCTKYHKFFIQNTYSSKNIEVKEAKDLSIGDKIIKCEYPVIQSGSETMNYAYTHGFFCGDGTYETCKGAKPKKCNYKSLEGEFFCKRHIDFSENNDTVYEDTNYCNALSYSKKPLLRLYDEKKQLIDYLDHRSHSIYSDVITLCLPLNIKDKYYVPANCDLKTRLEWFAGLLDADGCVVRNGDNQQLQLASIHYDFLKNVKFMLQTCGINPKIRLMLKPRLSLLPNGNGGNDYYESKEIYRLLVSSCDLQKLMLLGLNTKRLNITLHTPQRNATKFVKISKVVDYGRISDTYCFTEPKRHMGVFNGILTGQCTEVIQYSDNTQTAVCNLASLALPMFVDQETKTFDYAKLHTITKVVINNLNRVIDVNFYPTEKTQTSNFLHRPVGLGVQGLADVFMMLDLPFQSDEAKEINRLIFETIYHAAIEKSNDIAIDRHRQYRNRFVSLQAVGAIENDDVFTEAELSKLPEKWCGAYSSFAGSPASEGILQFDMWNVVPTDRYDWAKLRESVQTYGLRNSLLMAPMPTASTSQILGFNECIEPITSNIYSRRTIAGEFIMANKYLMNDLMRLNLWNDRIKNNIIANNGSVQQIEAIPHEIREKYRTVWEIPMRHVIDMAADRGAYICQSQSLNLWLEDPNYNTLTSMHFYSWNKGLKTGIYYLRRRGKHQAQQFTIEPEKKTQDNDDHEICEMCSS